MNYNKINYPNGYKKIVQPARPCPMPIPTPYQTELMQNMPLEPIQPMPQEPMPIMPPMNPMNQMNPMEPMPLEPMPTMPPMKPMKPMKHMTPMNPMEPMPLPTPNLPNQAAPALNLFPVDEGYVNGTIFRGLFRPYKNMRPTRPQLNTEKERMLFDVNKNHFAMTELQFYLNNFPNDAEALRVFNGFRKDYLKAKNDYESRFGALSIASDQLERGPWNWVQTTAPWKRGV